MPDRLVVTHDSSTISVDVGRSSAVELHALWLRDACSCPSCRHPTTNERLVDSSAIPLEITVASVDEDPDRLTVRMSDGHTVVIERGWLLEHVDAIDRSNDPAAGVELWMDNHRPITSFERRELDGEDGVLRWLDALLANGVALVSGVSPNDDGLREVASIVGEIRATNYGVTWAIEADIAPVSAVDSERQLLVHTDLPYREVAPGVQFLLAAIVDVAGGETTLTDGYAAAEELRASDPEAWRLLTTVEFSYPFVRERIELVGRAPIIGLRPNGSYHQIRRAPDLVGVPFLARAADAPRLYAALRSWTAIVDDPANEIRFALRPGDLLAFDNHRLLHGRTAFRLGASGRRRLIGCYLDIEDVRSRRAVAARRR